MGYWRPQRAPTTAGGIWRRALFEKQGLREKLHEFPLHLPPHIGVGWCHPQICGIRTLSALERASRSKSGVRGSLTEMMRNQPVIM